MGCPSDPSRNIVTMPTAALSPKEWAVLDTIVYSCLDEWPVFGYTDPTPVMG